MPGTAARGLTHREILDRAAPTVIAGAAIGGSAFLMKLTEGINWVFSATPEFERTVAFFRDVIGLSLAEQWTPVTDTQFTRYALLALPQGGTLEILEPSEPVRAVYDAVMLSLTVDDLVQARRELEGKGVEFVAPLLRTQDGVGWTYFRAPDGHVYQLAGAYHDEEGRAG